MQFDANRLAIGGESACYLLICDPYLKYRFNLVSLSAGK